MPRKRAGSVLEDLFDLAAIVPWWIGVILAIAAYVGLHLFALSPAPARAPGQVLVLSDVVMKSLANVFQYIVPLFLLAGAATSAVKQFKRRQRVERVASAPSPAALLDMTWQEFEALVSEAFRLRGFSVRETGGGGADGGVDLVLTKGADRYLVQCKQWRATKVGVVPIRELYGVMAAEHAAGGYMVTSGTFTDEARSFASGRNLELVDGEKLFRMFDEVRAAVVQDGTPSSEPAAAIPSCPGCGRPMVKRIAKKGANAGAEFWGCLSFPQCRGTRPIS